MQIHGLFESDFYPTMTDGQKARYYAGFDKGIGLKVEAAGAFDDYDAPKPNLNTVYVWFYDHHEAVTARSYFCRVFKNPEDARDFAQTLVSRYCDETTDPNDLESACRVLMDRR